MNDELDNPVWHALTGAQATWSERNGHAARFIPDAAPFFAIDRAAPEAYADLRAILGNAAEARLFRPRAEATPKGWRKTFEKPILQMVLPATVGLPPDAPGICALGRGDIADMMELALVAKPGPFGPRTHELGSYIGLRRDGRLVGMAGERFRLPDHTEISAVAVDPPRRGQGYGRALTTALASAIRRAGKIPLLHVFADNKAALKLYESIGFRTRAELTIVWLAPA